MIRILQKAKKDIGGDARVVICQEDCYNDVGTISSDYIDDEGEWAGGVGEDEDTGDEAVLTLSAGW